MLWTIDHAAQTSLPEQIAGCVRRGVADGRLAVGDRLPPAQELAEALAVDRNTVLAAYRQLRGAGILEFRRGRGVRVAEHAPAPAEVGSAAREFVAAGRRHGYSRADLIKLVEELA